jgi:hypothetical protein
MATPHPMYIQLIPMAGVKNIRHILRVLFSSSIKGMERMTPISPKAKESGHKIIKCMRITNKGPMSV